MARHRRFIRMLAQTGLAFVVFVVAFVVITALTAPGRRGLEGAEARARAWEREPSLRDLADCIGVRIGSAVMVRDIRGDPEYVPVLAREFNSVTPCQHGGRVGLAADLNGESNRPAVARVAASQATER